MGLESPSSRAERMARMIQIWGKVPPIDETVARVDAVTCQMVKDFAGHLVSQSAAAMALYGPVSGAPSLDDLQVRRAA